MRMGRGSAVCVSVPVLVHVDTFPISENGGSGLAITVFFGVEQDGGGRRTVG
jgi:hypothetical protein